ncbi:methyl-accepting chemotaxis protein [Clostridium oceanicum]|uniref:Methyl-accepting chemotaxis protein n=1 Tax=Clostridium oceanicum TaxID=1543 RepID=A0ABN1JI40_9CLOT
MGRVRLKKTKGNRKSFYWQIIRLLLGCIIIPVAVILISGSFKLKDAIQVEVQGTIKKSGKLVFQVLEDSFSDSSKSVEVLSKDYDAKNALKDKNSLKELSINLENFVNSHKEVNNVYIALPNKNMCVKPETTLPKGYDPTNTSWYKNAIQKKGEVIVTEPYVNASNKNQYDITYAKAVLDDKGNVVGVIGLDMNLNQLSDRISNISIGRKGYSLIIDNKGRIIAHKDKKKIGNVIKENTNAEEIFHNNKNVFMGEVNGEKFLISKIKDSKTGYTMISLMPSKELTEKIIDSLKLTIVLTILILAVIAIQANLFVKRKISFPLNNIRKSLKQYSKGNLTEKIEKKDCFSKEFSDIIDDVNATASVITNMLNDILYVSTHLKENSDTLVSITEESSAVGDEVAKSVQQIAEGASSQSEKVVECSNIAENLAVKIDNSMKNSNNMLSSLREVNDISNNGSNTIQTLTEAFSENYEANLNVSDEVRSLLDHSNKIQQVTEVMKGITEQTNLLALNASIEAARAGDVGKGFLVVAKEIGNLAEESAESASQIEDIVKEIKNRISSVSDKTKYSIELNDKTANSIAETETSFYKIKSSIEFLQKNVDELSLSLKETIKDKEKVTLDLDQVSTVSEEAAATSEEVSASSEEQASGLQEIVNASEELNKLAEKLKESVSKFEI